MCIRDRLYIDDRTGGRGKMPELIRYDQIASYEEYLEDVYKRQVPYDAPWHGH